MTVAEPSVRPAPVEVVIRPSRRWEILRWREFWEFRELLYYFTWRNVKVRYKQTAIGIAWAVIQPTLTMAILAVVLGQVPGAAPSDIPYPLFLFAGLLPWMYFAGAVSQAANSVIQSEQVVTKVYFPRVMIPASAILTAAVDFAASTGVLVILLAWYRVVPDATILLFPVLFLALTLLASGVGCLLAALNVMYRDFRYVTGFLVQVWMFATPSIFFSRQAGDGASAASRWAEVLRWANPVDPLIESFRAATIGLPMSPGRVAYGLACSVVILLVGLIAFRRMEDDFSDHI